LNTEVTLPNFQPGTSLLEYGVSIDDAEWYLWKKRVPTGEIDPQKVTDADLILRRSIRFDIKKSFALG